MDSKAFGLSREIKAEKEKTGKQQANIFRKVIKMKFALEHW